MSSLAGTLTAFGVPAGLGVAVQLWRHKQQPPRTRPAHRDQWADAVPGALIRAGEPAGVPLAFNGPPKPTAGGLGLSIPLRFKGAVTVADARRNVDKIASGLNDDGDLCRALEFEAGPAQGFGVCHVFRRDPLLVDRWSDHRIPNRPTRAHHPIQFAVSRTGRIMPLRIVHSSGAVHSGFFGRTRSGKSMGMLVVVDQLAECPDVLMLGLDMGPKFGADLRRYEPRFDRIVTRRQGEREFWRMLDDLETVLSARAERYTNRSRPVEKLVRFSPDEPLICLFGDEMWSTIGTKAGIAGAEQAIAALVKSFGAYGFAASFATQYPLTDDFPTAVSSQITNVCGYALRSVTQTRTVFGDWEQGAPGPHTILSPASDEDRNPWAGWCYTSFDGGQVVAQRSLGVDLSRGGWADAQAKATAGLRLRLADVR